MWGSVLFSAMSLTSLHALGNNTTNRLHLLHQPLNSPSHFPLGFNSGLVIRVPAPSPHTSSDADWRALIYTLKGVSGRDSWLIREVIEVNRRVLLFKYSLIWYSLFGNSVINAHYRNVHCFFYSALSSKDVPHLLSPPLFACMSVHISQVAIALCDRGSNAQVWYRDGIEEYLTMLTWNVLRESFLCCAFSHSHGIELIFSFFIPCSSWFYNSAVGYSTSSHIPFIFLPSLSPYSWFSMLSLVI